MFSFIVKKVSLRLSILIICDENSQLSKETDKNIKKNLAY